MVRSRCREFVIECSWSGIKKAINGVLNGAVPRKNLGHSQNEWLEDEPDAACFDKILAMILAMIMSLRRSWDGSPVLFVPERTSSLKISLSVERTVPALRGAA